MRLVSMLIFAVALAAEAAPKIDLNTAGVQALEALPGIGLATAQRIVRIRERNGAFRCVEELRAVPRLTDAQFQTLEREVDVAVSGGGQNCKLLEERRRSGEPVEPLPRGR